MNVHLNRPRHSSASWRESFLSNLHRYRALILRKGWLLVVTSGLGLLCAALYLRHTPPAFLSVGRMMVSGQIKMPEGGTYSEEANNFFGTQIELMRSGAVRQRAESFIAVQHPGLTPVPAGLDITQSPNASVFDLKVTSSSPEYSTALLDAVMRSYIDLKNEMRSQASEKTVVAITDQLKTLDAELREGQNALVEFQKKNNIVILQEQGNTAGQYLAKLTADVSKLRTEFDLLRLLDIDQNVERTKAGSVRDLKTGSSADESSQLSGAEADYLKARQQVQLLQAKLADLLRFLRPAHPKIVKLQAEIAQQENLIGIFKKQSIEQLASRREGIRVEIENLENVIKIWEVKALDLSQRMAEYQQLKQKVEQSKSLFDRLSSSVQGIDLNRTVNQEMVTVMESASPAISVKPVPKILALGAIAGFAAGALLLGLINRLDSRVHSITEVEDVLGEQIIGQVPRVRAGKGAAKPRMLVTQDDHHAFAESFKNIRSSLLFASSEKRASKIFLITSGIPNEGKSTIAENLAVTLAFSGVRTVLVDGDLRRGIIHKEFGVPEGPGFVDVIKGSASLADAVRRTEVENLFLLTRGEVPHQPGELLLRPRTVEVLDELRAQYDYIIIDSAPVLAADDTTSLAPKVDQVICVVRLGFTEARLTSRSLELLKQRHSNVLGVVANCVDSGPDQYYYQYQEYYSAKPSRV